MSKVEILARVETAAAAAPQPDSCDDDASRVAGERAIALMQRYGPTHDPRSYLVWYAYAVGSPPYVRSRLDHLLQRGDEIDKYEVDQLAKRLTAGEQEAGEVNGAVASHLDRQLDNLIGRIQAHIVSTDSRNESIAQAAMPLTVLAARESRALLKPLLDELSTIRRDSTLLTGHLQHAKSEIRKLSAFLQRSRERELRDPLTNLPNRRSFDADLPALLRRARQNGEPLCVAMVDIDHFKQMNDTFGHLVGDDVLREVSGLMAKQVEGFGAVYRFGGDEFAILVPRMNLHRAVQHLSRLVEAVHDTKLRLTVDKQPIGKVSISLGVAEYAANEVSDSLLERADAALYKAKKQGRDQLSAAD